VDRAENGHHRLLSAGPRHDLVRSKLLAWFRRERRQLPWRGTRDPYRIWVSEVMLQQTTVEAVRGRYEAFLRRFPDLSTLARAREPAVLAAWSGLGYYARARNLRRAARDVMALHGGRLPNDLEALRALPGFGDYTAAAVASLAFGARTAAADANVTRVHSRLYAIRGTVGTRAHGAAVRVHAEALVARGRPGDVTAALMDLGQLVCLPRRPACGECPLASLCVARRLDAVARFPRRKPRPAISSVFVAAACAARGGAALLVRGDAALLGGLWQFPSAEGGTPTQAVRALRRVLVRLGLEIDPRAAPVVTRHTIVHRRLEIRVYHARTRAAVPAPELDDSSSHRWFTAARLETAAIPTLTRRIAKAAGFQPARRTRILGPNEDARARPVDRGPRRSAR
jgi:A/G-specific adenine glycosylase